MTKSTAMYLLCSRSHQCETHTSYLQVMLEKTMGFIFLSIADNYVAAIAASTHINLLFYL